MQEDDDQSWNELLGAIKKAGAGQPAAGPDAAPPTFVSRMRKMRETLWLVARTLLWRRWSLVAIAVALIIYLVAYLVLKEDPAPTIPPPQPPSPLSS